MKARLLCALIVAPALVLGACHGSGEKEDRATCEAPKAGTITSVNDYCVIMNEDPVDPTLNVDWKGQQVGFCCKGCLPKWEKMSDAEKDAAVAKAVAKGKIKN